MTRIESQKVKINKPASEVYAFLSDFNNFQKLMPEQVVDWISTADECSFKIKGMASLGMRIEKRNPPTEVVIVANGKVPFDFKMSCLITDDSDVGATARLIFEADLNPFLKMMAEKPLTNFVELLAEKMKNI